MNNEPTLMTLTEVAKFLRVSRPTVYKLIDQGVIRGRKVGRQWRFVRTEIEGAVR